MKKIIIDKYPHLLHGGDYNPDQWQDCPEILKEDMRLMKAANCNEMTLGVFAWSSLEPQEGEFDFSFLDKAMDDIYAAGGRVILATPSGAKPVWMAKKYPEICRVDENGIRSGAGGRHNHCNNSPVYREKVRIINEKLAQRYKDHPALIAWHVSNEYGNSTDVTECYCDNCKKAFIEWLKNKYKTVDNLNHEWWTAFWSHTFSSFEEIDPPSFNTDMAINGRNLDWKRFISDKYIEFLSIETEPLRRITPDIPITTNMMEMYTGIDYREMAKSIDFVSSDNYPVWKNDESDIDTAVKAAFFHDYMRSLKFKPFIMMESTPSIVNWHNYNKLKRPGMHALSSLQAVAHGSDSVLYFQWRKSRGCSEKLHGAVVDHYGKEDTRVFCDVKELGARLKKLDEIVGTVTNAEVAIVYDVQNEWALGGAQGYSNIDKKYQQTLLKFYKPLWKRGINADIIGVNDNFDNYKLIIAPMLYMVSNALEKKLCDYVARGGTLVSTYMLGIVNENDLCHLGGLPAGKLKEVFGIWNEETDTLYPGETNSVSDNSGKEYFAVDYCELIHTAGAVTIATFTSDFYSGYPAFTLNRFGKGKAYYIAFRDRGDFCDDLINKLINDTGVRSAVSFALPSGVTAHSRTDGENTYVFLENHNKSEVSINGDFCFGNLETGAKAENFITLPSVSVTVLKDINRGK